MKSSPSKTPLQRWCTLHMGLSAMDAFTFKLAATSKHAWGKEAADSDIMGIIHYRMSLEVRGEGGYTITQFLAVLAWLP